jgi:phospholipase/carboxylesterase
MPHNSQNIHIQTFEQSFIISNQHTPATKLLIWIHGLGDQPQSFFPFAEMLAEKNPSTIICLPQAPNMPVTINQGMIMPSWYDILSLENRNQQDTQGMQKSLKQLSALIQKICKTHQIEMQHVTAAGFSQGGVMALCLAQHTNTPLEKIIVASGYLPKKDTWENPITQTPILWLHGKTDEVVPHHLAEEGQTYLKKLGFDVTSASDNLGHEISPEQWAKIFAFLKT